MVLAGHASRDPSKFPLCDGAGPWCGDAGRAAHPPAPPGGTGRDGSGPRAAGGGLLSSGGRYPRNPLPEQAQQEWGIHLDRRVHPHMDPSLHLQTDLREDPKADLAWSSNFVLGTLSAHNHE
ncbi:hypothetical protein FKM82_030650 [Ascaphus truei]